MEYIQDISHTYVCNNIKLWSIQSSKMTF